MRHGQSASPSGSDRHRIGTSLADAGHESLTPYTFRSADTGRFPSVQAEMVEHFLCTLGVDAVFTDNPDQFPRR
jgi:glycerophosphoryl diester phosphodiesterase